MNGSSELDELSDLPTGWMPNWEVRYPGRLERELVELRTACENLVFDARAIASNRLSLTFDWRIDAEINLRLRAIYPEAFPHMRPQVFLVDGLEPIPEKHINPSDGNLCLLGRNTSQWDPQWTLKKLLAEQLEKTIRNSGDEDPQAEPVEYWWNSFGSVGSYCLVDSAWDMVGTNHGTLQIKYSVPSVDESGQKKGQPPIIHSYVEKVIAGDGAILHEWTGALPVELKIKTREIIVPWSRLNDFPQPGFKSPFDPIIDVIENDSQKSDFRERPLSLGLHFKSWAYVKRSEVSFGEHGLQWAIPFVYGHQKSFKQAPPNKKNKKNKIIAMLPVLRAGLGDIGCRVPSVQILRTKNILVVGAGAVGAPLVMELARNGCGTLQLLEYDRVEPGNTIRWPLGTSSWGQYKLDALTKTIEIEYPETDIICHSHCIGLTNNSPTERGDHEILSPIINDVNLVIDASASHGVTTLLAEYCRGADVPMITLSATPTVEGGIVVCHQIGGGCPICLLHAWHNDEIAPPPGQGKDNELAQPPGCAERTFIGASYDLQELSLQAARLTVEILTENEPGPKNSIVQTLSLVDENDAKMPPVWRVDDLPIHPNCGCLENEERREDIVVDSG